MAVSLLSFIEENYHVIVNLNFKNLYPKFNLIFLFRKTIKLLLWLTCTSSNSWSRLTELHDIRILGCHLDIDQIKLDAIFQNKKEDIQEAVYQMLREWQKTQMNTTQAYSAFWEALTHPDVNLSNFTHTVLGERPPGRDTKKGCFYWLHVAGSRRASCRSASRSGDGIGVMIICQWQHGNMGSYGEIRLAIVYQSFKIAFCCSPIASLLLYNIAISPYGLWSTRSSLQSL